MNFSQTKGREADAVILSFDGGRIREVPYEDLEHVTLTRAFLNNPHAYLKHL